MTEQEREMIATLTRQWLNDEIDSVKFYTEYANIKDNFDRERLINNINQTVLMMNR